MDGVAEMIPGRKVVSDGMGWGVARQTPDLVITGLILTAGSIDSHIHFIAPQQIDEAISSGITTLQGGGVGPRLAPGPPRACLDSGMSRACCGR